MNIEIAKLGNLLYVHCPAAYRPLYRAYKAVSDRAERRLMRSVIRRGMTVVDVGANIGVYSTFLARLVEPEGEVHAFEPEPRNFAALSPLARKSPNIRAINAAVGAASGSLKLYVSDDLNVDHHTYDDGEGRQALDVPVIQLDAHFPAGTPVDFIKMDIQGYELPALQGAHRVLTENRNVKLLFEYWPYGLQRAGTSPVALLQYLGALGFMLRPVEGSRRVEETGTGVNDYTNIYAYRP